MFRSAALAVLAVALSSSAASAQTFAPEIETLLALGATLTQPAPIEKSDLVIADFVVELTSPAVMDRADVKEASVFRSAFTSVRAVARSSSSMFARVVTPASAPEATVEQAGFAVSYNVEVRAVHQRPASLIPLYAVQGTLQTLDLLSTWRVIDNGRGREANPLFKSGNHALMVGAKLGATGVNIYLLEKLWKTHPVTAVALLIGTNAVMSGVVVNNLRIGS